MLMRLADRHPVLIRRTIFSQAGALNRESIVDALRARHFYATTGNRPLIDLKLTLDGKVYMVVGTAPIDNIEIRNGLQFIKKFRPYSEGELGHRIKIVWGGAQVRGRDRLVNWDGTCEVQDNSILAATPLNFWNVNHPLVQFGNHQLAWKSVSTGGTAGVIVTLAHKETGTIKINTVQGNIEMDVAAIGLEPKVWDFGDLRKEIRIYRLPDQQTTNQFSFSLPLTGLYKGDNPIYIRTCQEDEYIAWTSPIYLVL